MMTERIVCNVQTNTVVRELVEDNLPQGIDCAFEIETCKQRLAETDYVVIKIAEGVATHKEYAQLLAEREALRARIGELERMQRVQTA